MLALIWDEFQVLNRGDSFVSQPQPCAVSLPHSLRHQPHRPPAVTDHCLQSSAAFAGYTAPATAADAAASARTAAVGRGSRPQPLRFCACAVWLTELRGSTGVDLVSCPALEGGRLLRARMEGCSTHPA